jgi:DNA polymerase III subunit alpha
MGCQVSVGLFAAQPGERPRDPAPIVLLAQNETGYENLMRLNSCLYLDKAGSCHRSRCRNLQNSALV